MIVALLCTFTTSDDAAVNGGIWSGAAASIGVAAKVTPAASARARRADRGCFIVQLPTRTFCASAWKIGRFCRPCQSPPPNRVTRAARGLTYSATAWRPVIVSMAIL